MTDTAIKVIALLSTFAGRAGLAAAVAIAALTLAPANAAPAEERTPAGASLDFNEEDGTLYIDWSAPILAGMPDYLRTAFRKYGTLSHRVVLFLNSAGGQVEEGDRVIQIPRPGSRWIGSRVSCPSFNTRTSRKPVAISSAPGPASSCVRSQNRIERAVVAPLAVVDTNDPGIQRRSVVRRHPQRRDDPARHTRVVTHELLANSSWRRGQGQDAGSAP
jgi:hypothetical protein